MDEEFNTAYGGGNDQEVSQSMHQHLPTSGAADPLLPL